MKFRVTKSVTLINVNAHSFCFSCVLKNFVHSQTLYNVFLVVSLSLSVQ